MSLIASAKSTDKMPPIPEGTYLAVCNMLIDLGDQYNEQWGKSQRKVLIGWELPEETIETKDGTKTRQLSQKYTNSLSDRGNLRKDLAAWRGRDFTPEELTGFDLKNIVGASCLLNIIHREYNGQKYANVAGVMALPKGMPRAMVSAPPVVIDLDTASLKDIDELPTWIGDIIKQSTTYQEMVAREMVTPEPSADLPELEELDGGSEDLPF